MPLSKQYTAKIVADFIRGLVKELEESELQPNEVLSYVNLAQQKVYNEVPEVEYYDETTLTISSNEADFSTKAVEKPVLLKDDTNGTVNIVSLQKFQELPESPSKQYKVYATQIGEKFKLYLGEELSDYGNLSMIYVRKLTPCTAEASYLDVKDRYVDKVIDIAKSLVYEQLGKKSE